MARARVLGEPQQSEPVVSAPANTQSFTPAQSAAMGPALSPEGNALLAAIRRRRREPQGGQPVPRTAPLTSGGLGANQPRVGYYG
jgi:hypothetical protein